MGKRNRDNYFVYILARVVSVAAEDSKAACLGVGAAPAFVMVGVYVEVC